MEELITAIYDFSPACLIQNLLQSLTIESLRQQSRDGLNVMHHAILASNPVILPLLKEKEFDFLPLVENGKKAGFLGYLHLASIVSDSDFLQLLCQMPNSGINVGCSRRCWPDIEVLKSYVERGRNGTTIAEKLRIWTPVYKKEMHCDEDELILPADVAAMFENIANLQILLTTGASKKLSMLEQAAEMNAIVAFRFLLTKVAKVTEINSAFKFCLSHKLVRFLRVLLDHGVNVSKALNDTNPYHVIYLCSSTHHQMRVQNPADLSRRNQGLVTVTLFLIEYGFNVNIQLPIGTYPLYSLITALVHEKDHNPTAVPMYHIEVLEVLLRDGANGNFDEVRYLENLGIAVESTRYMGRELSTSALNCYFACLQSCDTWRPHIMEHLDRLCLTLLENGANPDYVDAFGRTPLHDLMRAMASQHAMGHMHADLSTMSRMLLYFGANPNRRSAKEGEYPVECYFYQIVTVMGGLFAFRRWKNSSNIPQVLHLLYFMDGSDANVAYRNILTSLTDARAVSDSDGIPDDVLTYVVALMREYICQPKSLQELTRLALWKAVSRKVQSLRKLRMPKAFLASIKDLFALDV